MANRPGVWNFGDADVGAADDEETGADYWKQKGEHDCCVLLIDAAKDMFLQTGDDDDGDDAPSPFLQSLKAVHALLCRLCCSGQNTFIAIVFINTQTEKNSLNFKHIHVWQEMTAPGAPEVRKVEDLINSNDLHGDFLREFKGHGAAAMDEAIWICTQLCTSKSFGDKQLLLFTNNGRPYGNDKIMANRINQKVEDMKDQGILMEIVALGADFDGTFWKQTLGMKVDLKGNATLVELLDTTRSKQMKKKTRVHLPLKLAEGLEISVAVYNLFLEAKLPSAVWLDRKKNEPVVSYQTFFDEDTGEKLLDSDLQKARTYGGKRIAMETDEVVGLKRLAPPGIVLLGFKPVDRLKIHHHLQPSSFLYPNEKDIKGSTTLYRALLDRCVAQKVMAVCRMTALRNQPPKLVALVPQEELKAADGNVDQAAGFHVVVLPFADDLRDLSKISKRDGGWPKATDDQVKKAKDLIEKRMIKKDQAFDPDMFQNPALETHYRALEAMALERHSREAVIDQTKPDFERIQRQAGQELDAFNATFFPDGHKGKGKKKAGDKDAGGSGAKRARAEPPEITDIDLENEARAGRLEKLTVIVLKQLANEQKVKLKATKKADIIKEIGRHFGL